MKMPENLATAAVVAPPQPPPQKCPRCDSNNTKFCYYNNYSLTQPRYFCKTCRRYWTQGGTLRNVPVGGGCRKGKRTMKAGVGGVGGSSSSSSAGDQSSSRSSQPLPTPLNINTNLSAAFFLGNYPRSQTLSSMSPFYSSGGFLSSLAAMQSMTQSQGGVNQSLGVSSNQFGGTSSNMALLQGLHLPTPPKVDHQNQQIHEQQTQSGFYQLENREKSMESSFYPSDQTLFPPTRPLGSWTQRFINNNNNIWTSPVSTTADGGATNSATAADSSLGPNQWPDLPGFGPSP